jgi:hypothetical protein
MAITVGELMGRLKELDEDAEPETASEFRNSAYRSPVHHPN